MISFLDTVNKKIIDNYISDFDNLVIVLPSQRAGLFLKKKLISSLSNKTSILPQIISIETFITDLSELSNLNNEALLLLFYKAYLAVNSNEEKKDFESFLSWGQILLQDFNEIDRYLIDHKQFFNYLYYIKDQRHWFLQENKTNLIENYIQFWKSLELYYNEFSSILLKERKGYQGLQYRIAAQNCIEKSKNTKNYYLFVGFNALNEAEQSIFKTFQKEGKAEFIWDADEYFVNDKTHDASYFLKKHKRTWNDANLLNTSLHNSFKQSKKIHINGVPKNIGQVKYVGQLLANLSAEELTKTAVILADETLLSPLLNSLPNNVTNVNITMGQPLSQIPITNLITQLFELKLSEKEGIFYYKNIISLFQHNALKTILGNNVCDQIIKYITENNFVYVDAIALQDIVSFEKRALIKTIFNPWKDNPSLLNEFETILNELLLTFELRNEKAQTYYCRKILEIIEELKELISSHSYINSLKILVQFFNLKLNSETIDFRGEPFSGLQIMGVLESRCLDFDTVIITSVNEGTLPSGQKGNSFIPYDLKIEVKLPTFKEKDAIYAYHFYRLLQRCEIAYLIYNTEVDELNSGEKSRFIQQLELEPHPNHKTVSNIVTTKINNTYTRINTVNKDKSIIDKLSQLAVNGFSPSALTTYLRDPLTYYERYILGVQESKEIEEEIAANTLGTIIHEVLCNFYTPLEGKVVVEHDIQNMLKKLDNEVAVEFQKNYSGAQITHGVNLLSFEAAKQFIQKFLLQELDLIKKGNELVIVSIEKKYKTKIEVPNLKFPVYIKGTVDRVDRLNGKLRIVDYKTGFVDPFKLKIKDWETIRLDEGYSKALQILMYAYMYCNENKLSETVEGGIIAFKKLNQGFLPFALGIGKNADSDINLEVFERFLEQLQLLIQEICDINQPFVSNELKDS